jgi:thiamine-monophosphate kinase
VLSTDTYVEQVHFRRAHPPAWLAQKLLMASLADVAAMGAVPEAFTLAAALPAHTPLPWWEAFALGLGEASRREGVTLAGGDLTASPGPVVLTFTVWGLLECSSALTRAGAQKGDILMVLGTPGLSGAGLAQWLDEAGTEWGGVPPHDPGPALRAHLCPRPDLSAGLWARSHGAHAALDLSDGLARDAARLAMASGLDILLELDLLPPLPPGVELDDASRVSGGEDHDLLVLVAASQVSAFEARGFTAIGRSQAPENEPALSFVREGVAVDLQTTTFEHF